MKKTGKYFFLFILLFNSSFVFAKDINVEASLSDDKVSIGQIYTLSIIITGGSGSLSPPNIEGSIFSGSSQAKSFNLVNGILSYTTVFAYKYQAEKIGTFVIPSVEVRIKGQIYATKPIAIDVVEERQNNQSGGGSIFEDIFDDTDSGISERDLFIEGSVSKKQAYVYEPIYFEQTAYTRVRSERLGMSYVGSKEDFWFQSDKNDYSVYDKRINNSLYRAKIINREVLYPITSGKKTIEGNKYIFGITGRSIGLIDRVERGGKSYTINVMPLPQKGKPKNFSGGVGDINFEILAAVDGNIKAGDAVLVKIIAYGEVNPDIITLPNLQNIVGSENVKIYLPKEYVKTDFNRDGKVYGEKTAEYILLPKKEGVFIIPEIPFSFFSPEENSYKTVYSQRIEIPVKQGVYIEDNSAIYSEEEKTEVEKQPIKEIYVFDEKDSLYEYINKYLYIYMGALLLLVLIIFALRILFIRYKNKPILKNTNSFKMAIKLFESKDKYNYLKECETVFYKKLSSIFKTDITNISDIENINMNLKIKKEILYILEKCQKEKYIPFDGNDIYNYHTDMENILKNIK